MLDQNSKLSTELLWRALNSQGAQLASRTVDWTSAVGNKDVVVFKLPPRTLLKRVMIVINTASTNGAGLTTSTLSLGTTVGGAELLDATAAQALTEGAVIGNTLTELGASLPTTAEGLYLHAGGTVNLRIANAGGSVGVTAGSFSVYATYLVLPK